MWGRGLTISEKKEFLDACDVMFFDLGVSYMRMFSLQRFINWNTCLYFLYRYYILTKTLKFFPKK